MQHERKEMHDPRAQHIYSRLVGWLYDVDISHSEYTAITDSRVRLQAGGLLRRLQCRGTTGFLV